MPPSLPSLVSRRDNLILNSPSQAASQVSFYSLFAAFFEADIFSFPSGGQVRGIVQRSAMSFFPKFQESPLGAGESHNLGRVF